MALRLKYLFFIATGILTLWFFYVQRDIIAPFILAATFAYVFNPIVNYLNKNFKIPRTLSVILIYLLILSVFVVGGILFSKRVIDESAALGKLVNEITVGAKQQISYLPDFVRPTLNDTITSITNYNKISYPSVYSFLPQAFSRIISFIIFLFAAFYFLKEGSKMYNKFLNWIPSKYKLETEILLKRINMVLGGYLRGILFVVFLVSLLLFICLSILGVKYALILAIFSGFAEIVPIIGPIFAAGLAAIIAYLSGTGNFGLDPFQNALAVILVYFIIRQFQDYFINPYVFGKITKLHPLVILFAVLAGEHAAGLTGLILAVPIAGVLKVVFEYSFDVISDKEIEEKYRVKK